MQAESRPASGWCARRHVRTGKGCRRVNRNMEEWKSLENAILRKDWPEAEGKARELLDAWRETKHALLWFASEEVEAGANRFEAVLSNLVSLLGSTPVDVEAVTAAKMQLQRFLPPKGDA